MIKKNLKLSQEEAKEIFNLNQENENKQNSQKINFYDINSNSHTLFTRELPDYSNRKMIKNKNDYVIKEFEVDTNYNIISNKNSNPFVKKFSTTQEESNFSKLDWPNEHETIIQIIKNQTNIHNANLENSLENENYTQNKLLNPQNFYLQNTPSNIINQKRISLNQRSRKIIKEVKKNENAGLSDYQYLRSKSKMDIPGIISPNNLIRKKLNHLKNNPFKSMGNDTHTDQSKLDLRGKYSNINFQLKEVSNIPEFNIDEKNLDSKQEIKPLINKIQTKDLIFENAGETNIISKISNKVEQKDINFEKNHSSEKNANISHNDKHKFELYLKQELNMNYNNTSTIQKSDSILLENEQILSEIPEFKKQEIQIQNITDSSKEGLLNNAEVDKNFLINNDNKNIQNTTLKSQKKSEIVSKIPPLKLPIEDLNLNISNKLKLEQSLDKSNVPSSDLNIFEHLKNDTNNRSNH